MLRAKKLLNFFCFFIFAVLLFPKGSELSAGTKKINKFKKPSEIEYLLGKYRCSLNPDFKKIAAPYSDASPHYLLNEAAKSFEKMAEAALKDGIKLYIISGFRSYDRQKKIWEDKFLGITHVDNINLLKKFPKDPKKRVEMILKYSSAPGTSRHHWGTDLDINSVSPLFFETKEGKKINEWLLNNAHKFGFYKPYIEGRNKGYMEEKWHWSYKPLSKIILKKYLEKISLNDINGFQGFDSLPFNFFNDYVLGINDELI